MKEIMWSFLNEKGKGSFILEKINFYFVIRLFDVSNFLQVPSDVKTKSGISINYLKKNIYSSHLYPQGQSPRPPVDAWNSK